MDLHQVLSDAVADDYSLSSVYEIEDILMLINEVNKKIEYYKGMKAHKIGSIDGRIKNLASKEEVLRKVILNTMHKVAPDDKTLDFPDVGKISRRKAKDSWSIADEDKVLDFLKENDVDCTDIVTTVEKIDRRKLKTSAETLRKSGKEVPGTEQVAGSESISITFEKTEAFAIKKRAAQETTEAVDIEALDALTL